jgi:hypothetical protein
MTTPLAYPPLTAPPPDERRCLALTPGLRGPYWDTHRQDPARRRCLRSGRGDPRLCAGHRRMAARGRAVALYVRTGVQDAR